MAQMTWFDPMTAMAFWRFHLCDNTFMGQNFPKIPSFARSHGKFQHFLFLSFGTELTPNDKQ
jgi:hypothetical protein